MAHDRNDTRFDGSLAHVGAPGQCRRAVRAVAPSRRRLWSQFVTLERRSLVHDRQQIAVRTPLDGKLLTRREARQIDFAAERGADLPGVAPRHAAALERHLDMSAVLLGSANIASTKITAMVG